MVTFTDFTSLFNLIYFRFFRLLRRLFIISYFFFLLLLLIIIHAKGQKKNIIEMNIHTLKHSNSLQCVGYSFVVIRFNTQKSDMMWHNWDWWVCLSRKECRLFSIFINNPMRRLWSEKSIKGRNDEKKRREREGEREGSMKRTSNQSNMNLNLSHETMDRQNRTPDGIFLNVIWWHVNFYVL